MQRTVVRRVVAGSAAALVLGLTVTAGSLVALSKTVTISVDGELTTVATTASDVGGVLVAAGIDVAEHDTLAPGPQQAIADGGTIVLQRGRQFTLELDGVPQTIWTTATTVEAALAELGRDDERLQLSAARSRSIGLDGLTLSAETLYQVTVVDGGSAEAVVRAAVDGGPAPVPAARSVTTADTVAEVLAEHGVVVDDDDIVRPDPDTPVNEGLVITIDRVDQREETEQVPLPQPADERVEDPELALGTEQVRREGTAGVEEIRYRITLVNGEETERVEIDRTVVGEPVSTVIAVGTKEPVRWVGGQVFFDDHEFGINWDGLARCESTNNPRAVDPTGRWYGLFQFDLRTWASVGGSGNPIDASPTEQLMRAKMLYQSRGLSPWMCAHAAR